MRENDISSALGRAFREVMPGAVVYKHADQFTAGIPDLSVTANGKTAWIEVKYDRPRSKSRVSAAQRIAIAALPAFLVTYHENAAGDRWIAAQIPGELGWRRVERFNHGWVVDLVRRYALRGEEER